MIFRSLCLILVIFVVSCAHIKKGAAEIRKLPTAPLFNNIGQFHRPGVSQTDIVGRYFDQGLIMLYQFYYLEAARSFRAAASEDKNCTLCHIGIAISTISSDIEEAKNALAKAKEVVKNSSDVERALVDALSVRLAKGIVTKSKPTSCHVVETKERAVKEEYARAMGKVSKHFQNDPDVATLFAMSWWDVHGLAFFDKNGQPVEGTLDVIHALENALVINSEHPGANHLYIHVMEGSKDRERALPSAHRLAYLAPDAEHLVHMPSHIYANIGRYHDASIANQRALDAAKRYQNQCRAQGFEPEVLVQHDEQFLTWSSSMEGRSALALQTAMETAERSIALKDPGLFDEVSISLPSQVMARFGKWRDILNLPQPKANWKFANAMWRYARGVAFAELGNINEAKTELGLLVKAQSAVDLGEFANNDLVKGYFEGKIKIAIELLVAKIAKANGDNPKQIKHLKNAVHLDDETGHVEPPMWLFPLRESLGAAYYASGEYQNAVKTFLRSLEQYPESGPALFGLVKSYRALGKTAEVEGIRKRLDTAWDRADISIQEVIDIN